MLKRVMFFLKKKVTLHPLELICSSIIGKLIINLLPNSASQKTEALTKSIKFIYVLNKKQKFSTL